jgi:hypothetical protein
MFVWPVSVRMGIISYMEWSRIITKVCVVEWASSDWLLCSETWMTVYSEVRLGHIDNWCVREVKETCLYSELWVRGRTAFVVERTRTFTIHSGLVITLWGRYYIIYFLLFMVLFMWVLLRALLLESKSTWLNVRFHAVLRAVKTENVTVCVLL